MAEKVLVFRIGSLGDTVVALPSFHLIASAYPQAERRVLTNLPAGAGAEGALLPSVLENTGLVHGYISYPPRLGRTRALPGLLKEIRSWKPDVLIYLMPERNRQQRLRDLAFFKLCSPGKIIGLGLADRDYENPWLSDREMFEPEAERLVRNLAEIGSIDCTDPASWDMRLTEQERSAAGRTLGEIGEAERFMVCSIGTKQDVNDWGRDNWVELLKQLSLRFPKLGLVFIGASEDGPKSEELMSVWKGPRLNLCSRTSPRASAAILSKAGLFLGHDSGPMHLAAAAGARCAAIFSGRNKPGIWFPFGTSHRILYHQTDCCGCNSETCIRHDKKCIRSITVSEVLDAAGDLLEAAC